MTEHTPGKVPGAEGRIVYVRGSVVDVRFEQGLPMQNSLLRTGDDGAVLIEVNQHLDARTIRGIALTPTQGLALGSRAFDTGRPLRMPVGSGVLGRVFNVLGEAIDRRDPPAETTPRSIHQPPVPLSGRSTRTEIFTTGIKAIDELSPLERGGHHSITAIEDYTPLIGASAVERILKKAEGLRHLHVANVNSTFYGGGVAELLRSFTLLMNSVGIKTGWRAIQGAPDFFSITKKMHNALQGGKINLSKRKIRIYEEVILENAIRNHLNDHNLVIVHDPQPLPMIGHYRKNGPWIWRCHVDLSRPNPGLWRYLKTMIERYDAVILSSEEYRRPLKTPQLFFQPAIDPFSILNREMSEEDARERLEHYGIPTDLPLVVQVSRFDRWKDPEGVIRAFKRARRRVEATLVLLGNVATDDPEGEAVYHSLLDCREERILILSHQDTALVNALQRKAAVVLQKSIREGFGLTVAEAMWKGTPVIGGRAGGIRNQIRDGDNGFLVDTSDEAADRMVRLLRDEGLRERMGKKARESVRRRFLLSRYLENYLDLFHSFETIYRLKRRP